jgi:hypothetical protein
LEQEKKFNENYIYYIDFDGDGNSEKIYLKKSWENKTVFIIYSHGKLINQWNFKGVSLLKNKPIYGDINGDGILELFVFTYLKNKIYLHCFNPIKNKILLRNEIVSKYYPAEDVLDCFIQSCEFYDMNNDGNDEFYFSITTGFSIYPRNMYCFDVTKDTLFTSPKSCASISQPVAIDFSGDGKLSFVGSSFAVGNCAPERDYTDIFTWLMVFDEKMNFKFKPLKIGYYPSNTLIQPIRSGNNYLLAALNIYYGVNNYPCSISLYDSIGKKINEKSIVYSPDLKGAKLIGNEANKSETLFIIRQNGIIDEIDINLNIINKHKIIPMVSARPFKIDIDADKQNELIFLSKDHKNLIITRSDFTDPVLVDIHENKGLINSSLIYNKNEDPKLYIVCDNYSYTLKYYKNPLYYLKYLVYSGVFFSIFIFIYLMQRALKYRIEQKYIRERKIIKLQLSALKNQIDPHFTLNIINSIGSLFYKEDREQADYLFGKFSKLLRLTLLDSDKIKSSIEQEIDYVENYLALQKFRLNNSFEYNITIDEAIYRKIEIPKMLIYTFVENAIKHGLRHRGKGGILNIEIKKNSQNYLIKIIDNGVGREKAKTLSPFSTGKGLLILDQILDLYQNLTNVKIVYYIKDLFTESDNPLGTEVLIKIAQAKHKWIK